jgi:hypothetical protein
MTFTCDELSNIGSHSAVVEFVDAAIEGFLKVRKFVVLEPSRKCGAVHWFDFFHKKTPD